MNKRSFRDAQPREPSEKRWLTEAEVSRRLNISQKWLQKKRLEGGGLRFAKFGSAVRYSLADVEQFEDRSLRSSTSDERCREW